MAKFVEKAQSLTVSIATTATSWSTAALIKEQSEAAELKRKCEDLENRIQDMENLMDEKNAQFAEMSARVQDRDELFDKLQEERQRSTKLLDVYKRQGSVSSLEHPDHVEILDGGGWCVF